MGFFDWSLACQKSSSFDVGLSHEATKTTYKAVKHNRAKTTYKTVKTTMRYTERKDKKDQQTQFQQVSGAFEWFFTPNVPQQKTTWAGRTFSLPGSMAEKIKLLACH